MSLAISVSAGIPEPGQLVRVRGRHWVVADVSLRPRFPFGSVLAASPSAWSR